MHSVNLVSSLMLTSSATQAKPSIRTQLPNLHRQDIIVFYTKQLRPMVVPYKIVQLRSLVPAFITQLGPTTTLGPILQFYSITADLSINT